MSDLLLLFLSSIGNSIGSAYDKGDGGSYCATATDSVYRSTTSGSGSGSYTGSYDAIVCS